MASIDNENCCETCDRVKGEREGQCDADAAREVLTQGLHYGTDNLARDIDRKNAGERICGACRVDWRARAKAAEADIEALRYVTIIAIDTAISVRTSVDDLRALRADVNGPNWRERIKERA